MRICYLAVPGELDVGCWMVDVGMRPKAAKKASTEAVAEVDIVSSGTAEATRYSCSKSAQCKRKCVSN
jgi:hypothetical protein